MAVPDIDELKARIYKQCNLLSSKDKHIKPPARLGKLALQRNRFNRCMRAINKILSTPDPTIQACFNAFEYSRHALELTEQSSSEDKEERLVEIEKVLDQIQKTASKFLIERPGQLHFHYDDRDANARIGNVRKAAYKTVNFLFRGFQATPAPRANPRGGYAIADRDLIPDRVGDMPICYDFADQPVPRQFVPNGCPDATAMVLVDFHQAHLTSLLEQGGLTDMQTKAIQESLLLLQDKQVVWNPAIFHGRDSTDFQKEYMVRFVDMGVDKENTAAFLEKISVLLYEYGPLSVTIDARLDAHQILVLGIDADNIQFADVWDGKIKEMPAATFANKFADPDNQVGVIQVMPYSFKTIKELKAEQAAHNEREARGPSV